MNVAPVLIVDDQPDLRDLMAAILSREGYGVVTADGGTNALRLLADGTMPKLIVLDVQMPDMDGWETLERIRSRFGEFGPRVVLCTVKGHPNDLLHGWTLGCDGYVWKPFDLKLFLQEVRGVLARTDAERGRVRRTAVGEALMLARPVQEV